MKSPLRGWLQTSTSSLAARVDEYDIASDVPAQPPTRALGRLWSKTDPRPLTREATPASTSTTRSKWHATSNSCSPSTNDIIRQPETRPISQEQLVAEVKGIYAGLVMVESKCIEVVNDNAQSVRSKEESRRLDNDQWQALIALHRTLLHEHHDFFLASQHPSASPALKRLAGKYAMPVRMWRHGIYSFLELLRHRLPASLEHMLSFIYLAYSMMALLYETVPAFEDTWIECLGDLGRYRMAIEEEDIRDREIWTSVSRHWYTKASGKVPTTGRLYHHLAILARPNAVQQLFYYAKSLCVAIPFKSARDNILTLFDPIFRRCRDCGQTIDQTSCKPDDVHLPIPTADEKKNGLHKSVEAPGYPLADNWSLVFFQSSSMSCPSDWGRPRLSGSLSYSHKLFLSDWFNEDEADEDERHLELPSMAEDHLEQPSWIGWENRYQTRPMISSGVVEVRPGYRIRQEFLSYLTIRKKFLLYMTAIAIPVARAEILSSYVDVTTWALGSLANVPSIYVLANPPVPSSVGGRAEEIVWKVTRGW